MLVTCTPRQPQPSAAHIGVPEQGVPRALSQGNLLLGCGPELPSSLNALLPAIVPV
jgi:hypothetical protein